MYKDVGVVANKWLPNRLSEHNHDLQERKPIIDVFIPESRNSETKFLEEIVKYLNAQCAKSK